MSTTDVTVECPHCGEPFQLTEALAAPLLDAERDKLNAEARRFVARERAQVEAKAKAATEAEYAEERKAMQESMADRDLRLKEATIAELAARKAKAEADAAKRDVDLIVERKVQEVLLAFWLEHKHSKDQILQMYLNRVYFGSGAYGVEAA